MQSTTAFRNWLADNHDRQWSAEVWPRAFWFDVFVSHRRFDWSRGFAQSLATCDLAIYHDDDVGVVDAEVDVELNGALRNARFIVVCASPELGVSLYCRAEYAPALEQQATTGVTRVLVAVQNDDAPVPPELASSPRFRVDTPAGITGLVELVKAGLEAGFPQPATLTPWPPWTSSAPVPWSSSAAGPTR